MPGDTYKYTLKCKTCIFVLAQTKLASLTYYIIETNRVGILTVDSESRKKIHLVQPFQVVLVQQQQEQFVATITDANVKVQLSSLESDDQSTSKQQFS